MNKKESVKPALLPVAVNLKSYMYGARVHITRERVKLLTMKSLMSKGEFDSNIFIVIIVYMCKLKH